MARRHAEPGTPSVSRPAYFGGIVVGIIILIGGYYSVSLLGIEGFGAALAELGVVALALVVVTMIWKVSVLRDEAAHQLDSTPAAEDRDGS